MKAEVRLCPCGLEETRSPPGLASVQRAIITAFLLYFYCNDARWSAPLLNCRLFYCRVISEGALRSEINVY